MYLYIPRDKVFIATCIYFCLIPCVAITSYFLPSFIPRRVVLGIIIWGLILLSGTLSYFENIRDSVILFLVIGLIFAMSSMLFPEYSDIYEERVFHSVITGVGGISGYLIIRQNKELDMLKTCLKVSGYVLFIYYFWRSFEVIKDGYWTSFSTGTATNTFTNSSMEFGYSMLLPSLIFLYLFFRARKPVHLVISLIGLAEIVLYGGRGPILAYGCYIVFYILFVWMKNREVRYKWLKILAIIAVVLLFYIFYESILNVVVNYLQSIGIQSRALTYLIEGEATADNGRNWIWATAWEYINSKSLLVGYAPLSDIYYMDGYYCHNLILELMFDFGLLPGLVISIGILYAVIRTLIKCKSEEFISILIIFVCCGFVKLFISSSLWQETNFWILLGLLMNYRYMQYDDEDVGERKNGQENFANYYAQEEFFK